MFLKKQYNQNASGGGSYDEFESTLDDIASDLEKQQSGGGQPGGEQPGGGQPGSEQPGGGQPGSEQPGGEQPGGGQRSVEKIIKDKRVEEGAPVIEDDVVDLDDTDLSSVLGNEPGSEQPADKKTALETAQKVQFYEEHKDIFEDPVFKAFAQFRKAGKTSWSEFAEHITGPNLDAMSDADVFRFAAKVVEGLTEEEEIEDFVNEQLALPDRARNKELESIRGEARAAREQRVKEFGLQLKTEAQLRNDYKVRAHKDLSDLANKITGKMYCGTVITPEMMQKIGDAMKANFALFDSGKGYLIKESFDYHFFQLFRKDMIKNIEDRAISKGRMEATEHVVQPASSSLPRNPAGTPPNTDEKDLDNAVNQYIDEQADGFGYGGKN